MFGKSNKDNGNGNSGISRASILRYMQENITDAIDPLTGEVCATSLLEDAAWSLGVSDEEGSDAWEIAAQLASSRNGR